MDGAQGRATRRKLVLNEEQMVLHGDATALSLAKGGEAAIQSCTRLVPRISTTLVLAGTLLGLAAQAEAQQEPATSPSPLAADSSGSKWSTTAVAIICVLGSVVLLLLLLLAAFCMYHRKRLAASRQNAAQPGLKQEEGTGVAAGTGAPPAEAPAGNGLKDKALGQAEGSAQDSAAVAVADVALAVKPGPGSCTDLEERIGAAAPAALGGAIKAMGSVNRPATRQGSVEALLTAKDRAMSSSNMAKGALRTGPQPSSGRLPGRDEAGSSGSCMQSPNSPAHSAKLLKVQALADELSGGADSSQPSEKLTLLQSIGKGGFGHVYKAKWRGLDVAVKTVLFNEARNGSEARALMEAAVCSSVVHNNVVCTYHYDISPMRNESARNLVVEHSTELKDAIDYKLWLVQELCTTSLRNVLYDGLLHTGEGGQVDLDPVLTLLADVARGVEYIHAKNIIHGDLKPENVLLKMSGASPIGVVAKITDFGLSHAIAPDTSHLSGIRGGTPYYQAPETMRKGILTKSSDVYGFGVLMWEVYSKKPPWVKRPQGGYAYNRAFGMFPPTTPGPYATLARRCLDPGPRNRPTIKEVAAEIADMLEAYLDGYDDLLSPKSAAQHKAETSGFKLGAETALHSGPLPRLHTSTALGDAGEAHVPGFPLAPAALRSPPLHMPTASGPLKPGNVAGSAVLLPLHPGSSLQPGRPVPQRGANERRSTELVFAGAGTAGVLLGAAQPPARAAGGAMGGMASASALAKPHRPSRLVLPAPAAALAGSASAAAGPAAAALHGAGGLGPSGAAGGASGYVVKGSDATTPTLAVPGGLPEQHTAGTAVHGGGKAAQPTPGAAAAGQLPDTTPYLLSRAELEGDFSYSSKQGGSTVRQLLEAVPAALPDGRGGMHSLSQVLPPAGAMGRGQLGGVPQVLRVESISAEQQKRLSSACANVGPGGDSNRPPGLASPTGVHAGVAGQGGKPGRGPVAGAPGSGSGETTEERAVSAQSGAVSARSDMGASSVTMGAGLGELPAGLLLPGSSTAGLVVTHRIDTQE